jgi:glyoxylase-like metal-dependent hydrolase (beta-lactamase superfamily II)
VFFKEENPMPAYPKGLYDLGNTVYAYMQPDGSWGWSNAGLVADSGTSLLIDTLFDLKLTQEMLNQMRASVPAASHIETVVNTHANGDHYFGNQLVANAQIIASTSTAHEMQEAVTPAVLDSLGKQAAQLGPLGNFLSTAFGPFDFQGITVTPPQKTFEGEMSMMVGNKEVIFIEVGPAHTRGDTLVYIPGDRVVFTGDILFIGTHPIMWAGPTGNWLRAIDRILSLNVDIIVPGHGPLTDKKGVIELKGYLEYVYDEARQRYAAGMSAVDAARDIPLDRYATWTDGERIVVNVATIYRELSQGQIDHNVMELLSQMGTWMLQHPRS